MDVESGTEVMLLAVRRDVADLTLAHRVYDAMRRSNRWGGLVGVAGGGGWLGGGERVSGRGPHAGGAG